MRDRVQFDFLQVLQEADMDPAIIGTVFHDRDDDNEGEGKGKQVLWKVDDISPEKGWLPHKARVQGTAGHGLLPQDICETQD